MADGYFLEAISICENVVADCLDTHLARVLGRPRRRDATLGALLAEGRQKRPHGYLSLEWRSIEEWNKNKVVSTFDQTGARQPWQERYQVLKPLARRGLVLARKVRSEVGRLAVDSDPFAELSELEDVQQRIDLVADDLTSGPHRYAVIDTSSLAELLEVDFDDGSGHFLVYVYRETPDNAGFDHPLAENLDLLMGQIPRKRYLELACCPTTSARPCRPLRCCTPRST